MNHRALFQEQGSIKFMSYALQYFDALDLDCVKIYSKQEANSKS